MSLRLFGITGGLASGKSTVAARMRAQGVPIIDADELAREVVAPGTEGLAAVVAAFGPGILADDGVLDRARLAAIVFEDDAERRRLDAILHPRIAALSMARAAELSARGETLAGYEAALLVENGLADAFRPLVVVAVDEQVQIARAIARDRCTEGHAKARIAAQLPLASKIAVADYVIDASGDREATERATDEVLRQVRRATRSAK